MTYMLALINNHYFIRPRQTSLHSYAPGPMGHPLYLRGGA